MKSTTLLIALAAATTALVPVARAQHISFRFGPQYAYRAAAPAPAPLACYPAPVTTIRYTRGNTVQTYSFPGAYYYPPRYTPNYYYRPPISAPPRGWVPAYYNPRTRQTYVPGHGTRPATRPHHPPRPHLTRR